MFSICIPVYNTDCSLLLDTLKKQINNLNIHIEVIVADDCSTVFTNTNISTCEKHGFKHITNKQNIGRIATRLKLATESNSDYILFLDADMVPKSNDFIYNYLQILKTHNYDVFVGGCIYQNGTSGYILRLNYGKAREEVDTKSRNNNPYNYIFFGNILISKKLLFDVFNSHIDPAYGEDIFLSSKLKTKKINILHIDNGAYHLGLENNLQFLKKIETAANTLGKLYKQNQTSLKHIKLIRYYNFLKQNQLNNFVLYGLTISYPLIKSCLVFIGKPVKFVDLYRLYHFLKYLKNVY